MSFCGWEAGSMQSPAYEADSVVTLTEKGLAAIDELHDGGTSE